MVDVAALGPGDASDAIKQYKNANITKNGL